MTKYFEQYDGFFKPSGNGEAKFICFVKEMPQFKFAPDEVDQEHGVAVTGFVILDASGNLAPLANLDKAGDLFLHGVVTSWDETGDRGFVIGNIGPIDEW